MKKTVGIYSILLGFAVLAMWGFLIIQGDIEEGLIEMGFHLYAEFIMAVILIVSGFMMLGKRPLSVETNMTGHAIVVYSVLNAAGYYGQRGEWSMVVFFIVLFLLSVAVITSDTYLLKKG